MWYCGKASTAGRELEGVPSCSVDVVKVCQKDQARRPFVSVVIYPDMTCNPAGYLLLPTRSGRELSSYPL